MSIYTSVNIHPIDSEFQLQDEFLHQVLRFFDVDKIEVASGCNVDTEGEDTKALFFLQNQSLNEVRAAIQRFSPDKTHLSLPLTGFLRAFSDSALQNIPAEIAGDFLPWDTGVTIGSWNCYDYDTGEVTVSGRFCISKSANGCPPDLGAYLEKLNELPEMKRIFEFLGAATGCEWTTTIHVT